MARGSNPRRVGLGGDCYDPASARIKIFNSNHSVFFKFAEVIAPAINQPNPFDPQIVLGPFF